MSHGDEDIQLLTPIIKIRKLHESEQGDRGTNLGGDQEKVKIPLQWGPEHICVQKEKKLTEKER